MLFPLLDDPIVDGGSELVVLTEGSFDFFDDFFFDADEKLDIDDPSESESSFFAKDFFGFLPFFFDVDVDDSESFSSFSFFVDFFKIPALDFFEDFFEADEDSVDIVDGSDSESEMKLADSGSRCFISDRSVSIMDEHALQEESIIVLYADKM